MSRVKAGLVVALGAAAAIMSELVWVRILEQILGSTALSVAATTGAFLCAMGLGAHGAGSLLRRGWQPVKLLVIFELLGAAWALFTPSVGPAIMSAADTLLSGPAEAGFVTFHYVVASLALVPPGLVAGSLVPLVAEVISSGKGLGRDVAWLWVWDAVFSALAALVTGLWLLRNLGVERCCWVVALVHIVASALAYFLALPTGEPRDELGHRKGGARSKATSNKARSTSLAMVVTQLVVAGVAGVGWQAMWSRLLALALPGSLFWPSIMIASWIGGSGVGALAYLRSKTLRRRPLVTLALGQIFCAAAALIGAATGAWLRERFVSARPMSSAILAELAISVAVALPAAAVMGALIPAAIDLFRPFASGAGRTTGRVLATDLLGSTLGTIIVPLIMIPWLGLKVALVTLAGVQAIAGAMGILRVESCRPSRSFAAGFFLLLLAGWLVVHADLSPWEPGDDREPVRVIWGPLATAAVVLEQGGALRLYVDRHHGMGGEQGVFIERRQGHIPLLLHGGANSVLVVGVGTGNTLGAVTRHDVDHVDAAESLGSVLSMIDLFGDTNHRLWRDERVTLHHLDGHALMRRSPRRYDVIIGDLVHPWRAGASGLYSREHLQLARERLAPGGLFCLWLPLHELAEEDLSMVAATFLEVFGQGVAILGHLGWRQPIMAMIGGDLRGAELHRERLSRVLGGSPPQFAVETDLDQPEDIQSLYLGGTDWLQELAGESETTTWDKPELAYRSASTWWRGTQGLGQRTLRFVLSRGRPVEEVAPGDENAARRHRAVAILLRAELSEADGELEEAAQGYLDAAREDPTFRLPQIALELLRRRP